MSVHKVRTGWQVDYYDAARKRKRKTFTIKADAERFERHAKIDRERGVLPATSTPTLADFVPVWRRESRAALAGNTMKGYETSLRLHILPRLGAARLSNLNQRALQSFVASLHEDGMHPAHLRYVFAVLSVVLTHASLSGYCPPPTRRGLRFPAQKRFTGTAPTVEQVERLAAEIDVRFHALILVCGYCGLRKGEALALHPGDVQWKHHRIHVHSTLDRSLEILPRTKSGKDRYVTMPARVEAVLRAHVAEYPHPTLVFHHEGEPVESSWLYRQAWDPARTAAGLEGVRFHDLRHGAATIMAEIGGWGPKKVQTELGHGTAAFTLERYGHLWVEAEDSKREDMDRALEARLATRL